ncbi:endonuclease V [Halobacteriales archaeon Cl-PHB]
MEPVSPEFVPDPSLSREAMEQLQRDIAAEATFADDVEFDPQTPCEGVETAQSVGDGSRLVDTGDQPLVAGVDQAFHDGDAVSAIVVLRDGEVIEQASAVVPTEIPYIPGLLSFREGGAILAAFEALESEPDVAFFDGSGRIHFREAGLATHVGVALDLPSVGVAKKLLCGTSVESLDEPLAEGSRVAIESNQDVTAPAGTTIGYAVQTRQFDSGNRYINPVYVSPGHRLSAETAADLAAACSAGYKLPEPTRLADSYADDVKQGLD